MWYVEHTLLLPVMSDPLLAKLDRLMRQMERGELLDEDPVDATYGNSQPKKRGGKRRRRPAGNGGAAANTPFKNWNSNTTSGTMREYDALRDPHCRYTKQKQFKKQYEHYARAQMISDVLRGDHASLLDVVQNQKPKRSPRVQNSKNAPRRKRDKSGYGASLSKQQRTRRKQTKRLPGIGPSAGQGRRSRKVGKRRGGGQQRAGERESSPGLPRAPHSREENGANVPPLPSVMMNGGHSTRRGQQAHRNKNNESWKRVGGSTSVNDAVLKYRDKRLRKKRSGSGSGSSGGDDQSHHERVHLAYQKKRRENHRYSTQARQHAYQGVNLPPMPNEVSPRGGQAAFRRTRTEEEHQQSVERRQQRQKEKERTMGQPQVDSPPAKDPEAARSIQLPPSAMMERPDGVVANMMGGDELGMSRRKRGRKNNVDGSSSSSSSSSSRLSDRGEGAHFGVTSMFDTVDEHQHQDQQQTTHDGTLSSTFFDDPKILEQKEEAENNKVMPASIGSPTSGGGDNYSEDDFDDDDFEDEEPEDQAKKPNEETEEKEDKIQKKQNTEMSDENIKSITTAVPYVPITLEDIEQSMTSRFRGKISTLVYNLVFNDDYQASLADLCTLHDIVGTFGSDQRAVSNNTSSVLNGRAKENVVRARINLGRTLNVGLSEVVGALDIEVGRAESDISSQKNALRRVLIKSETKDAFDMIKIPMMIVRSLHTQEELELGTEQFSEMVFRETVCSSLDSLVRTTAVALLRHDADASGEERCNEFVQFLGGRPLLFSTLSSNGSPSTTMTELRPYHRFLSPATKGAVVALLWQACHGSDRGTKETPGSGQGTRRMRCVVKRDDALKDSYQWASKAQPNSWIPSSTKKGATGAKGHAVWDRRLSSQLLFPYFKRSETSSDGGISGGLEEGEGSGPRKEFFSLIGTQLSNSMDDTNTAPPFIYIKAREMYWLAPLSVNSEQADEQAEMYRWVGMLMGCALTSRCHLGVNFPMYLFKCLLSSSTITAMPFITMEEADDIQPDLVAGFYSLRQMDDRAFRSFVDMEGGDTSLSKEQVRLLFCMYLFLCFFVRFLTILILSNAPLCVSLISLLFFWNWLVLCERTQGENC